MAKKRRPAVKKKYHHGNLREAMMRAALDMIQERGAVDFNLREIASATSVSVAAIYRHFDSKDALMAALAGRGFGLLGRCFDEALRTAGNSPRSKFNAYGEAYLRFAVENEGLFRVMFSREFALSPRFVELKNDVDRFFALFVRLLSSLSEDSGAGEDGLELTHKSLAAWGLVHGMAYLWIDRIRTANLSKEEFLQMGSDSIRAFKLNYMFPEC